MKEQYFESPEYFLPNQTTSDGTVEIDTQNGKTETEPYVKFPEPLYKTPRAYRRKIGYVAQQN